LVAEDILMRRLFTLCLFLAPLTATALPHADMAKDAPKLIEIRVPLEDVELCQATLAMVMLRPDDTSETITVETDIGLATFLCVPE
jgi:hypothetical protein